MTKHYKNANKIPSRIVLTNDLFIDFLNCEQKLHLSLRGNQGDVSEYIALQNRLSQDYLKRAQSHYLKTNRADATISPPIPFSEITANPPSIAINVTVTDHLYSTRIDGLVRDQRHSANNDPPIYVPILFIHRKNISKLDKMLLAYSGLVLSKRQRTKPEFGRIIHGPTYISTKVRLDTLYEKVGRTIRAIKKQISSDQAPAIYINKHCNVCEFEQHCYAIAQADDSLSLLRGLTQKNIAKLKNKGIFTITQYSYTFRPRRKRKRPASYMRRHHPELQALAIRENKVYVYETPKIPKSPVNIYFDVEGIPDQSSYYLIGVLLQKEDRIEEKCFWANNCNEETLIFWQFIELAAQYHNAPIFHYGSYELQYIKRMARGLSKKERIKIDSVLQRCCNLLSYFHSHIYVPTYSNSLKDIARYLNYKWANDAASGIQSIVWRTEWERIRSAELQDKLKQYNRDDCYALVSVHKFIESVIANDTDQSNVCSQEIEYCKDIKPTSVFNPGIALSEMKYITKCSYFDYQRQRVFVRSDDYFRELKKARKKKRSHKNTLRTNEVVLCVSRVCPKCKSRDICKGKKRESKKVLDLKFTKNGIKKWVVRFDANNYQCRSCKHSYLPSKYKGIRISYGHNLRCWSVYHKIVNRQSDRQIEMNLYELFGVSVSFHSIKRVLKYFAEFYRPTYLSLRRRVISGDVLYADETPIKTKYEEAYAWVFTNNRYVLSLYKPNREGGFLAEFLKGFNGVLVTDFFPAYDTIECKKQRCLIHLMRDLNDDILKNPFDDEFREMTSEFTQILQNIVKTIDRYGLKTRFLRTHKDKVESYLEKVGQRSYSSEVSQQYKNRFIRYKDELFEFLSHDNVSWNNSIAEHAIRLLELHTNKNIWFYQSDAICDYLVLSSIYQTCMYNEISFLKFLLSREKNIEKYIEAHR
jgi:predicted RecB family nuclease